MPPLREDSGGCGTAVTQFGDHWWGEICKKSRRAVVFIDNAAAECLHWHGGLLRLERDGGVVAVKELSSFEAGSEGQKKAVFIVDGPAVGLRAEKIGEILRGSHFEHCAVITNASPAVHNLARHPDRDNLPERHTFDALENTLLEWMGDFNYTAEVFYMPFCTAALSPSLFVFPSASDLFPLLDTDLRRATDLARLLGTAAASSDTEAAPPLDFAALPPETRVVAQHFVSSLNALFQAMDVVEDVFSVGAFSKMLGSRLEQLASARNRRKGATKKASLILIDRSLDLATPSRCRFDSLLDRIRAALPPLPGHSNDVQIEMAQLFEMEQGVTKKGALCPGCLSDCLDTQCFGGKKDLVGSFIMESEATAISSVLTELEKVPSVGNLPSGDDDMARLRSGVRRLVGERRDIAANINVVQKAVATLQAFDSSSEDRLTYLAKLQGDFATALNESVDEARSFLVEIVKMVRGRRERGVTLDDVLVILVFIYGSIPSGTEFYPEDEDRLRSVFSEAVVQDRESLGAILNSMAKGMVIDEILAHQMVENVFKKLRCLPTTRSNTGYRDISGGGGEGLVAKLMRDIYSDDRHDVGDLFHHGQGLVGKSLSLFGVRVSRLHPRENPTVVVVLVGGITASEVRQIHQIVREKSGSVELLVGATRMINPHECSAALFQKDPLHLGSER